MLLNPMTGTVVHIPHISPKDPKREAILTPLREVHEPEGLKCHHFFSIQSRAKLKNA